MDYGSAADSVVDISGELEFDPRRLDKFLQSRLTNEINIGNGFAPLMRFARSQRCEICYSSPTETDLRSCTDCGATACFECFGTWLSNKIFGGFANAENLCCISCPKEVTKEEIRELCGKRTYRKLLYFLSRAENRENLSSVWCSMDGCWLLLSTTAGSEPQKTRLRSFLLRRCQANRHEFVNNTHLITCEECVSACTRS